MASTLRVMTYNIRYDNPADGEDVWRHRRDEVASVIRFHKPDIVGLQEALHDQLQDLRERLPRFEWISAGRRDGENAGEYAAIGYDRDRFNIESDDTFWLSESPDEPGSVGWDADLPRIVTYGCLRERTTGVKFYHFNTHFDHAGETARRKSAELLQERIDENAENEPVIVTGDFNSVEDSEPYRILTERTKASEGRTLLDTHHSSRHMHHGPITTMTDFHELFPDRKIDYVFVSADVEVIIHGVCSDMNANGRFPSDHLPVVIEASLPELEVHPG